MLLPNIINTPVEKKYIKNHEKKDATTKTGDEQNKQLNTPIVTLFQTRKQRFRALAQFNITTSNNLKEKPIVM
jgi:hypothetical protein